MMVQIVKKKNADSDDEDKMEEIMEDSTTQIDANNKKMLMLFDERKEMILKLMAMVEELQKTANDQREQNLILMAEILKLRAKG